MLRSFAVGSRTLRDDFEGLAVAGGRFLLVSGNGRLYETAEAFDGGTARVTMHDTGLGRLCEIEGLAWEPADRVLLLLCRRPRVRALIGQVTILRWSPDRQVPAAPDRLTIPMATITRGTRLAGLHPSDLTRDAVTGNYLIVAAEQGVLVERRRRGGCWECAVSTGSCTGRRKASR